MITTPEATTTLEVTPEDERTLELERHKTLLGFHQEGKIKPEVKSEHETKLESIEVLSSNPYNSSLPFDLGFTPRNHTRGDRDFGGNGPRIDVGALISVQNTNELWASLSMIAEETAPDWTTVSGGHIEKIWDGDDVGVIEIVSIDSDRSTRISYTDTDHYYIWVGLNELVRFFVITGDTDGNDVGRTRMHAYFNPVTLTVRKPAGPHAEVIESTSVTHRPSLARGDREFDGNGPEVLVWAGIAIHNTNEIWATIYMRARETQPDWTTAASTWGYKLWDGDEFGVKEVTSINSDTFSIDSYTDTDHAVDDLEQPAGELVKRFRVTGDTSGDDVGTDTGVVVEFNPVRVTVLR